MNETGSGVIDEFKARIARLAVLLIIVSEIAGAMFYLSMYIFGIVPEIKAINLIIFWVLIIFQAAIGIYLYRTCLEEGLLVPKKDGQIKRYFFFVLMLNINMIYWLFPSGESWVMIFHFLVLAALMLDVKLLVVCEMGEIVSVIIHFACHPSTLPSKKYFVEDFLIRGTFIGLVCAGLLILVYYTGNILLNAKKEELEKSHRRTSRILHKMAQMAEELGDASKTLLSSFQAESASTQELSAISDTLLGTSQYLKEKADESKNNLSELKISNTKMEQKMKEVDVISNELVQISTKNEEALNNLTEIS